MRPSYQERVIAEQVALAVRLADLKKFIGDGLGETYATLPSDERYRLWEQAKVMGQYNDILLERIAAFGKDD